MKVESLPLRLFQPSHSRTLLFLFLLEYLSRASGRWVVARAITSRNANISESEIRARIATAQNIVAVRITSASSTRDTAERNAGDCNTVCGATSWSTVEVILLDIDTVVTDVRELDVAVCDVLDSTGGIRIGLDAASVLGIGDGAVGEGDAGNSVVGFAANGTDGKTVASRASHACDENVGTGGDGDTVVLVLDDNVFEGDGVGRRDIEAIRVVGGWVRARFGVRSIASRVVESEARDGKTLAAGDFEAVSGPVLDVQVGNDSVSNVFDNEEVIGLVASSVGSLTIPIGGSVAVDDVAGCSSDSDVVTLNNNRVEVRVGSSSESGGSGKSDGGSILEGLKIDGGASRGRDVV
jgi:hypothetical protein